MTGQAVIPSKPFMDEARHTRESAEPDRDVVLMARVAKGDEAAFTELVERHQHAVVGTVAKMLGDRTEAEDIAQKVFLRLWKSAGRYRPSAKFTTYLFTITRNLVFNESRRRSRHPQVSIEEREQTGARHADPAPEARPDEELLHRELGEAIDTAIAALPEKQRIAVVLRRYQEIPYEEIAKVLGVSVSSVKSLLFRARESLRQNLSRYIETK
jgi:RNA polymerase sigma-70 factor (ECF subfamily)